MPTNVVLTNVRGGAVRADPDLPRDLAAAARRRDPEAEVQACDPAEVADRARAAADAGARTVVVCGGDGTVSAAAGALAGRETALAVVPTGTLNHFARDAGVPADLSAALDVAFGGDELLVDVARVNGRAFVNNCSLGVYPSAVAEREKSEDKVGKLVAMTQAVGRVFASFPRERVRVRAGAGEELALETPLVWIGNNRYAFTLVDGFGQRARLDEGVLVACVAVVETQWDLLGETVRALFRGPGNTDGLRYLEADRFDVAVERGKARVAVDGEAVEMDSPLRFTLEPRALRVRVPRRA